jgi:hypothetical protein
VVACIFQRARCPSEQSRSMTARTVGDLTVNDETVT